MARSLVTTCKFSGRRAEAATDTSEGHREMHVKRKSTSHADLRLCAAAIGCSAVVAMAAIGLMVAKDHDGREIANAATMQVGSTSTQTTPSKGPTVAMAKPLMRGPAPLPSEVAAAK